MGCVCRFTQAIPYIFLHPVLSFYGCKGQQINTCSGGEPGDDANEWHCFIQTVAYSE